MTYLLIWLKYFFKTAAAAEPNIQINKLNKQTNKNTQTPVRLRMAAGKLKKC